MRRFNVLPCILLATLCLTVQLPTALADISYTGDIDPADPANWNSSTDGYVGKTADGTLTVNDDSDLNSYHGYIGYNRGVTGVATVSGTGSTWNNSGISTLHVGRSGNGTLNITNGGAVNSYTAYIGCKLYSTGEATVDGTGSMWTIGGSYFYVGAQGHGTLNITNGGAVISGSGGNPYHNCIGHNYNSSGVVTVDGSGSTWTNNSNLYVSVYNYSRGVLNITDGGAVSNSSCYIGYHPYSKGAVTVDGTGSTWTNNGGLHVGISGSSGVYCGTLNITGGAAVSATSVLINNKSRLAIDVGRDSLLTVGSGSGTITNNGTVRVLAGAGATTGESYSPISATTWSGSGIYQAVGGTWNETEHEFTVSAVEEGTSGTMVSIDLNQMQRLLIDDNNGTGWSVGASFLAADVSTTLNFTATAIDGTTLTDLESLLDEGESVLSGWTFMADNGYTPGDPAYLSFDIGADFSRNDLQVWHFDGTTWTNFDAMDLTYDGAYASFTVTGFSGYAVSAVPEPGMFILLIAAAAGLTAYARGKR